MTKRKISRVVTAPWKVIFSPFKAFKEIAPKPDVKGFVLILGLVLLATAGVEYAGASKIFVSVSERQPVSPKLHTYQDAYVYVTAFGNYTFRKSQPYVMSYTFIDETPLIEYSIFWVNATETLTPVDPVVTIADDTSYQTTVELNQSTTEVGNLTLTIEFYSDARPKISTLLTKTAQWGLGNFTINWFILSPYTYYLSNGTTTIDLASKSTLSLLETNVNGTKLGGTAFPNKWDRSILIDWSDTGNATLYGGSHTLFTYSGPCLDVVFNVNQTKVDPTTVGLTYSSLLASNSFGGLLLSAMLDTAFVFLFGWLIFAGALLLITRGFGVKGGSWGPFFVLVGYTFSVFIIQWTASAVLIATLPEIRLHTTSWPLSEQDQAAAARNFGETWGPTPAYQALAYLTFPYFNIFDIWLVLLSAIAVHAFGETTWAKAAVISTTAFLVRFMLKYFLGF